MNYYVEFTGELKDDVFIQKHFVKQYNKICNYANEMIPIWNAKFDNEVWDGEPIEDYLENEAYNKWMKSRHVILLIKKKMRKDMFLTYTYDDELQLIGTGRYGKRKGKTISFILKEGA